MMQPGDILAAEYERPDGTICPGTVEVVRSGKTYGDLAYLFTPTALQTIWWRVAPGNLRLRFPF